MLFPITIHLKKKLEDNKIAEVAFEVNDMSEIESRIKDAVRLLDRELNK